MGCNCGHQQCLISLIQSGIEKIQIWASFLQMNFLSLPHSQTKALCRFPKPNTLREWGCQGSPVPCGPQMPMFVLLSPFVYQQLCQLLLLLTFFLLLQKEHLGERSRKCWLTLLYFILLPDLGPKILHCSVNSPVPSNTFPIVLISSCSQEESWISFCVCDGLLAKITQILHSSLYKHRNTQTYCL